MTFLPGSPGGPRLPGGPGLASPEEEEEKHFDDSFTIVPVFENSKIHRHLLTHQRDPGDQLHQEALGVQVALVDLAVQPLRTVLSDTEDETLS